MATTVVLAATAGLAIALTRGGSSHVSWAPTEGRKPILAGNTVSFYAVNSALNGKSMLRYVDSAGWAIVYPRGFHGLGYSSQAGTAASDEGAAFANFTPAPAGSGPVPPDGVLLAITNTWYRLVNRTLGHDSRFPLHLPASFSTHATGAEQSIDADFQADNTVYRLSIRAGPKASHSNLDALARMVTSISFPPAGGARASALRSPHGS
jgi:hypothetical protein